MPTPLIFGRKKVKARCCGRSFITDPSAKLAELQRRHVDSLKSYHTISILRSNHNIPHSLCHGDGFQRFVGLKYKACIINNTSKTVYVITYPYRITEVSGCFGGLSKVSMGVNNRSVSQYRKSAVVIPPYHHQNIQPPGFKFYLSVFVELDMGNGKELVWKPYLLNYCCNCRHDFYIQENVIKSLQSSNIPGYHWNYLGVYVAEGSDTRTISDNPVASRADAEVPIPNTFSTFFGNMV